MGRSATDGPDRSSVQRQGGAIRHPSKGGRSEGGILLLLGLSCLLVLPAGLAGLEDIEPTDPDPPYVTSTSPADAAVGVRVNALIEVRFSIAMNTSNTMVFIVPPIALSHIWIDDRRLWVTHGDFATCSTYRIYADAEDVLGRGLLLAEKTPGAPNPWSFTTECAYFMITLTDPVDNETDVIVAGRVLNQDGQNIDIWFSRPVDVATFRLTLTPSIPLTPVWSDGNGSVTMRHDDTWFRDCTLHTVTVSANDTAGNSLLNITGSKPNPWTFTTVCLAPQILSTDPANGTVGVLWGAPIVVRFSMPMDVDATNWSLAPDPGFAFAPNWTEGDKVLTLTHIPPFGESDTFTVTIVGRDADGQSLIPGPAPNPWTFTTAAFPSAPPGLHVARSPPDLVLTWGVVAGATSYRVYGSANRSAPWPWPLLADVPTTSFVDRGAEADGALHHYIVRARRGVSGVEGENSTMGVKAILSFAFDPGRTNVYWMSLPYRSIYRRASDLSDELTSSRIDIVGKWDPATQGTIFWYYFRGAWRGTDIALDPGDGFYLGTLTRFEWVVVGTDGPVPHTFADGSPPNVHWLSLPYTAVHTRASDLVIDIEGGTGAGANRYISEVARWDPILQRFVTFSWSLAGWFGTDFPLLVGEGISFRVRSQFVWTPRLVTPEVP